MTTIFDLLSRHGIQAKKVSTSKGGEYSSACPGCGGRDRFRIWPEEHEGTGGYWCRQCKRGGDCIQFLRDFEGLTFHQACERLGRPVPDSRDLTRRAPSLSSAGKWDPKVYASPEDLWREKATKLTWWAHDQLFESANAAELRWLQEVRGLTLDTVFFFALGWNPGLKGKDLFRPRESWGLMEVKSEETGKPRRLWLPVGLVIPWIYHDELRRLKIRRRKPVEFGPPYYVIPGSSMATMILPSRAANGWACKVWLVVEAELDAILVWQEAGDLCGVIALGSASVRPDAAAAAILRQAVHIIVALDNDEPGRKEFKWWAENMKESAWHPAPKGKDPAEAWKAGVNIREWVIAGLPEGLRMMLKQTN